MADIYVSIRNQDGVAMSSINGELVIVLVTRDGLFQAQQPVRLRTATAIFQDVPAGEYSIIVRHPDLTPTEVRSDVQLFQEAICGLRFFYNEAECYWLRVETELRFLP